MSLPDTDTLTATNRYRYIAPGGAMTADYTDLQLLHELEPVVEKLVDRHMSMRKDWNPHDYIPW
jgi:hypothetical protein